MRHEKNYMLKECPETQTHSHKCGTMQGNESQTFSIEKHFESCNFAIILNPREKKCK
jgi:hypothetical protein